MCGSADRLQFDHIIPWSKGGAATVANVQLLCWAHNSRKSDRWEPSEPATAQDLQG